MVVKLEHPKTWNDADISRSINASLRNELAVDETAVAVSICNGVVTLRGHVTSSEEKHLAELLAKHATGVTSIANDLDVRHPASHTVPDLEIRRHALAALRFHRLLETDDIQIHVRHGAVTMEGAVASMFRHDLAEISIMAIEGVASLRNHLTTKLV